MASQSRTVVSETVERERDLLVKCIGESHEALRLLPGVNANGPALVWLADHLLAAYQQDSQSS